MDILTRHIEYKVGDKTHRGYMAYDTSSSLLRPGVLVVHEWWGVNAYMSERVHQLAEAGYLALAIDMYGEGKVAANPEEAGSLKKIVVDDMDAGTEALRCGYQLLLDQAAVDSERTAAIGYCFGGAMVLHMARLGMPLSAVASFHGSLGAFVDVEPGSIQAEILVCHGEADSMVGMDQLTAIEQELNAAEAKFEVLVLTDAKHGFSSKEADQNAARYGLDLGYNADADEKSWQAMIELFNRQF